MDIDREEESSPPPQGSGSRKITEFFPLQPASAAAAPRPAPPPFAPPVLYQTSMPQMAYAHHGREALEQVQASGDFGSKSFGPAWRMEATPKDFGGSGKDEMTSTSTARGFLSDIDANPHLSQQEKRALAGRLSMHRTDTDSLVWHSDGAFQGHPGALRYEPYTQKWASKGHWTRDRDRSVAAKTEFQALAPNPASTSTLSDITKAIDHTNARTGVETVRTMSLPFEHFQALGESQQEVYHTGHGDIRQKPRFAAMAAQVHNAREMEKWDTAAKLRRLGLSQHVSPVMHEYLERHGNDHHQAMHAFQTSVGTGAETRLNTASASQAQPLDGHETLAATAGRKRALSDARSLK